MGRIERREPRRASRRHRGRAAWVAVVALMLVVAAAPASANMRSVKLDTHLCETRGGGKFVPIPEFPGEKIDRRLLRDVHWLYRHYDVFITDGYSLDPVHEWHGEHPIGLATDIVPYFSRGGNWDRIGKLAHRFEPHQNQVRLPMRWVGWNGDPGHGRGNHLHLSWAHSPTEPNHPAHMVYTRKCPDGTEMQDSFNSPSSKLLSPLAPPFPDV
jgi:hypothetical protein